MTSFLNILKICVFLCILSGCSKFISYSGPEVTHIEVYKQARTMHLMHHNTRLKTYNFELGFAPTGHKTFEGDGKTPEGRYYIDRKNPNSQFYLSLGISYPNAQDRAKAAALGKSPGGIFSFTAHLLFRLSDKTIGHGDVSRYQTMKCGTFIAWLKLAPRLRFTLRFLRL